MREELEKRLKAIQDLLFSSYVTDSYRLELNKLQMRLMQLYDDLYSNL